MLVRSHNEDTFSGRAKHGTGAGGIRMQSLLQSLALQSSTLHFPKWAEYSLVFVPIPPPIISLFSSTLEL